MVTNKWHNSISLLKIKSSMLSKYRKYKTNYFLDQFKSYRFDAERLVSVARNNTLLRYRITFAQTQENFGLIFGTNASVPRIQQ